MTRDQAADKLIAAVVREGKCPFGMLSYGQIMSQCPLGFPGCGCADEWLLNEFLQGAATCEQTTTQEEPTTDYTVKGKVTAEMPEIRFSPEDLLERTQLAPGWRTLICKSIDEGPGKNDPSSIVYTCVFVVDGGKENGVPIRHWFSEKAMGRIVDYIKCFIQDVKADTIYDLNKTVGLKVDGYCQYDLGQGYNTIKDWRPTGKSSAATQGGKKQ